jgi:hypothetical protein
LNEPTLSFSSKSLAIDDIRRERTATAAEEGLEEEQEEEREGTRSEEKGGDREENE